MINTSVPRSLDGGQLSTLGYYLWESPQAQEGRGLVMVTMKMIKSFSIRMVTMMDPVL